MPLIRVRETEPFDVALRRFKRSCEKAGIVSELRRREFYEKPTAERKRKKAAAIKRSMKQLMRSSYTTTNKKQDNNHHQTIKKHKYRLFNKKNVN